MTDLCAIQGQLVDVRNVFTDKCVKLTIHVSAERAMEVMTAFGWPTNVSPVSVAIARLNADGKEEQPSSRAPESKPAPPPDHTARAPIPFSEKPYDQQAGILGSKPRFRRFLAEHDKVPGILMYDEDTTAQRVREICQVQSRTEIRSGTRAEQRWLLIVSAYEAWNLAPSVGAA